MSEVYFIYLTKNQKTLVDKEDYDYLNQFHWQAIAGRTKKEFYAIRNNGYASNGTRLKVRLHRELMNAPDGYEVDHINGDTLDNRKSNLRICSHAENVRNQKSRGGKSIYRGVTKHINGYWRSRITVNYRRIHLGLFKTEYEAHLACEKARKEKYV